MATEAEPIEPTVLDSEPVPAPSPTTAPVHAEPVAAAERVAAVDVLRGFALLGILAMNIVSFGWGDQVYGNPMLGDGFQGADRAVWVFNHIVFDTKMMTTFSMLFGAGLVLMSDRAEGRGARLRGVYYRRILWLLVFGAIHGYLIWSGDILFLYAECGLLLYLFRRKSAPTLIVLGVTAIVLMIPLVFAMIAGVESLKARAARLDAEAKAGRRLNWTETQIVALHPKLREFMELNPDPKKVEEELDKERRVYRGGYLGIVKQRAPRVLIGQIIGLVVGFLAIGGRMLLGMGLMKAGVFAAERSRRFYLGMALLGYGVGLPLVAWNAWESIRHNFQSVFFLRGGFAINYLGSVVVALGHVAALMLVVQSGALTWLTDRLAAVGRMALTNYLTHSILCTTLFYGYGFGLFGHINRVGLAGIVLLIWAAQLSYSPVWLARFRFGPAEWLWRSLTYWRIQPIRRPQAVAVG
ncbi:MAG TPA: DUF418 domain-containing protein [Isosphaeraceae bacterium]|jgi:uncharacterized protein|nr:DUF418 domain-containing protein [Isosphaeraceae bacterium]